MNCPSCGAPLRLKSDEVSLNCDYCKTPYLPEMEDQGVRVLGEAAAESCPICSIPLMHAAIANERLLYCTRCRGMLIPMETFMAVIDELHVGRQVHALQVAPDLRDLQRKIDCPVCHHPMDTHFYGGPGNIVIDDCSRCFVNWLDHGELTRIVSASDWHYDEEGKADGIVHPQSQG